MANPKTRNVKPNATLNTASNTMTTDATPLLPSPSAPVVADNADPADLTNEADVKAVSADIEATIKGYPGGVPAKEGGFPPLLARALDVRLGAAKSHGAENAAFRVGQTNAILRASWKAACPVRLFTDLEMARTGGGMTHDEWALFLADVAKLAANPKAGKEDRTLAGVGRRIAAAEKAVKRAAKTCDMPVNVVRARGESIACAIASVERSAENQRAYLRAYRA